jgi:hypothetical protein
MNFFCEEGVINKNPMKFSMASVAPLISSFISRSCDFEIKRRINEL